MERRELRVVIVDDEELARERLRHLLERVGGATVVAECAKVEQAVDAILANQPDLVFLDVQLGRGSGFDVLDSLGTDPGPSIVFVTAHEQFALRAFEAQALDYLLKPFSEERFRSVMDRVHARVHGTSPYVTREEMRRVVETLRAGATYPQRLMVRSGSQYEPVRVADIVWIEAANNYVHLHLASRTYLMRESMSGLQERLSPEVFVRVQRSAIVNVNHVAAIKPWSGVEYQIVMDSGAKILSGRSYREHVRRALLRD